MSKGQKGGKRLADMVGARKTPLEGKPDPAHASTPYVERQNPTMLPDARESAADAPRPLQAADAEAAVGLTLSSDCRPRRRPYRARRPGRQGRSPRSGRVGCCR